MAGAKLRVLWDRMGMARVEKQKDTPNLGMGCFHRRVLLQSGWLCGLRLYEILVCEHVVSQTPIEA